MPFSLRLDSRTEGKIRRIARTTGLSKSAVVREAVEQYGNAPKPAAAAGETALDRLRAVVGLVDTGGAELSTDTHAKYRASLATKHRDRRPR
jgi:predicted DNA-binding protein